MRRCLFVMLMSMVMAMSAAAQDYYPNQVGNQWRLQSTDLFDTRVVRIDRVELLSGHLVNVLEAQTNENPPDRLYLTTEPEGIRIHRSEVQLGGLSLAFDYNPPQIFLPFPLAIGTSWQVSGETLFLGTVVETLNHEQIVAIEDVDVPAGTFQNTFKIQQDIDLRLPIGDLTLQSFLWLAPDVGVVREINTSEITFELVGYTLVPESPIAVDLQNTLPTLWADLKAEAR